MPPFPAHAELTEYSSRSNITRVTGGIDPVKANLLKPSSEELMPDRGSHPLAPPVRVNNIGDLALALSSTPDMQLTHANHVAVDPRCIRKPQLKRLRPRLDRSCHERASLLLSIRTPGLEAADLGERSPGMDSLPVSEFDLAQSHRLHHKPILPVALGTELYVRKQAPAHRTTG